MDKKQFTILIIATVVSTIGIYSYTHRKQAPILDKKTYIAYVAGEGIARSEFEKENTRMKNFFTWSKQDVTKLPLLKKDIIERLIEAKMIREYAQNNNIQVTEKEIQKRYTTSLGKKTEKQILDQLKKMYGMGKDDYLRKLSEDILKEKVQKKIGKSLAPWLQETKKTIEITRFE